MTRLGRKARKHRGKVVVGLAFAALLGGLLTLTRTPIEVRLARILFEMKEQRDLGRSGEAFARGMEAAGLLEGRDREDPKLKPYVKDLDAIMSEVCRKVDIETTPEGARITVGPNEEFPRPVASWSLSGISPLKGFPVPRGYNRWSVSKEGYPTYEFLRAARGVLRISLDVFKAAPKEPEEMVYVAGGADPPDRGLDIGLGSSVEPLPLPGFYIDLLEVTNRRYKEFVDEGGYEKPEYWEEGLKECTKTWDEVRKVCIEEKTGKPGPRFWVNGMYPDGQDAYPVCGVSWFEAAAYARYRGKRLPSVHHWAWAVQASGSAPTLVPSSNIGKEKLARAGEYPGRTGFGARDMAGNVREWCWNESGRGRFILGGAWSDADYMSTLAIAKDPLDRDRGNGFRCILPAGGAEPPAEVWNRIDFPTRDYGKDEPMEDPEFQDVIRRYYTIADPGELDPRPDGEPVEEESLWIRERITFKAAYSDERVAVILFKPKGRPPPWQPILFVPTAGAILLKDSKKGELDGLRHIRALLAGGWAIIYPVFKYTYERGGGGIPVEKWPKERDLEVCPPFVHDVSRCIDYIRTRPDFDAKNVGYYGVSLGACIAPLGLALETRIRAAVLVDGGLLLVRKLREFEFFHYCPRVKAQVLMLNGKFDPLYPYELSQKPMFDWLRRGNALDEHDTSSATFHTYDPSLRIPKTQAWFEKHLRAGALAAKP